MFSRRRCMPRMCAFGMFGAFVGASSMKARPRPEPKPDLVDTAVAAGSFQTLVAAVQAAGLADTLKGPGPFTVFAPDDEAFAKLPAGTLDDLLKPENKDKLTRILTYHVVPGMVLAKDIVKMHRAETVAGSPLKVDAFSGVKVNDANVVKTDIKASNGVIHVIDTVLVPSTQ